MQGKKIGENKIQKLKIINHENIYQNVYQYSTSFDDQDAIEKKKGELVKIIIQEDPRLREQETLKNTEENIKENEFGENRRGCNSRS